MQLCLEGEERDDLLSCAPAYSDAFEHDSEKFGGSEFILMSLISWKQSGMCHTLMDFARPFNCRSYPKAQWPMLEPTVQASLNSVPNEKSVILVEFQPIEHRKFGSNRRLAAHPAAVDG